MWGGLLFFFRMHEAELLHLVPQGITADVEQFGGMGLISIRLVQRHLHQRPLYFL